MAHSPYPESFPLECVSELIQIGRGGMDEIIARKSEVGLHLWNVQGFAQKALLGDPDSPPIFGSSDDEANAGEQLNEFCNVYAAAIHQGEAPSVFAADRRIDWKKVIAIVKELLPIILPLII